MMIIDVKVLRTGIVLCFVYSVASHPRLEDKKDRTQVTGSVKTATNSNISKAKLGAQSSQSSLKEDKHKILREADDIEGSIEIDDDENIEGHIDIPDIEGELQNGGDINNDAIDEKIYIPDENSLLPQNDNQPKDDDISGTIEIDSDENIEGTINIDISDDNNENNFQPQSPQDDNYVNTQINEGGSISGSIEMDSENIEGTINISDDGWDKEDVQKSPEDYNGEPVGDISGVIEIDEEGNIDGDINLGSEENDNDSNQNFPSNNYDDGTPSQTDSQSTGQSKSQNNGGSSCWMKLNSKNYLDALDSLDAKYLDAREKYQNTIGPEFDKQMMEVLLISQGKAPRAIHEAKGDPSIIPAGLNLGGFGMMRMAGSVLFFHRLKLRNHTKFRVDYLQADLKDMTLYAHLTLHDLHLEGAYERAITQGRDMSVMEIVPNYGELEVLLKHVIYKMEARLRMLNNRLIIELVNSRITAKETLLSYDKFSPKLKTLMSDNLEDFVDRLKCDLDYWLKDYFNDYLMYFGIVGETNSDIQMYEKQKTVKLNEYADVAIEGIKQRVRDMGFANAKLPQFTINSVGGQKFYLKSGVLRGLETMYRRSVAMTKMDKGIRTIDSLIGFSNLKVEYRYEALVKPGEAALKGTLILSADELSAHLAISHVKNSDSIDINLDNIVQLKTESLTVEGPANRLIADFRFILENPIIAIMTNVLKHNIKMLKTLPRCKPNLWGEKPGQGRYKQAYFSNNPSPPQIYGQDTIEERHEKGPALYHDGEQSNGQDTIEERHEKGPALYHDGEQSNGQDTIEERHEKGPALYHDGEQSNGQDTIEERHEKGPALYHDGEQSYSQGSFNDREQEFIENEDEDRGWNDYVFSKNDSVEIEVPLKGKNQTYEEKNQGKAVINQLISQIIHHLRKKMVKTQSKKDTKKVQPYSMMENNFIF